MGFVDPVRLCEKCAHVTKREKEFFDEKLKVLFAGEGYDIVAST